MKPSKTIHLVDDAGDHGREVLLKDSPGRREGGEVLQQHSRRLENS